MEGVFWTYIKIYYAQMICAKFQKIQQFLFINSLYKIVGTFSVKSMQIKKSKMHKLDFFRCCVGTR